MTTGRIELGPTGRAVAANVKRLREGRRLTLRALSALMREHGRPLSADALNKIENGASTEPRPIRRVDADDLMALAVVLGVHPSALLLPPTARDWTRAQQPKPETVTITGAGDVPARAAWEWAHGMRPLTSDPERDEWANWLQFSDAALPEAWEGMSAPQYREWAVKVGRERLNRIADLVTPREGTGEGGPDGPSVD
ncbi:helix-turn-helix domain-containing protein [Streptomyces microflavus]|uniref:helix-turn-helix domain-containing protein n=1 Tax=Streptomyces microflavus TaxID=1919 RepID=UPI0033BB3C51